LQHRKTPELYLEVLPLQLPLFSGKGSGFGGGMTRELIIFNGLPRLTQIDWVNRTAKIGKKYYYWRND